MRRANAILFSDQEVEDFIFDCMLQNEIKYMLAVSVLKEMDSMKYTFLSRSGGVKFWCELLQLQTKSEFEMMRGRKEHGISKEN